MEVSPGGQFASFLAAVITGGVMGLTYDALAELARRLRFALIRVLFDILFWAAVLLALAWYAFAVGGGELRLYALAGVFLGGIVYFAALSGMARKWIGALLGAVFWLLRVCVSPVVFLFVIINKFCRFLSNLFHFAEKHDILYQSADVPAKIRERMYKRGDGAHETQEAKIFYRYRNRNLLRLRRHQLDRRSNANQRTARAESEADRGTESREQRQRRFTSGYRI